MRYDITNPDDLEAAQKKLREYAGFAMTKPDEIETPLSNAQRFVSVQASSDPVVESNLQLMESFQDLRSDVLRAIGQPASRSSPRVADTKALRTIIDRVVGAGRAQVGDFTHVANSETSRNFDDWATRRLARVMGTTDELEINEILFHPDTWIVEEDEPDG